MYMHGENTRLTVVSRTVIVLVNGLTGENVVAWSFQDLIQAFEQGQRFAT